MDAMHELIDELWDNYRSLGADLWMFVTVLEHTDYSELGELSGGYTTGLVERIIKHASTISDISELLM